MGQFYDRLQDIPIRAVFSIHYKVRGKAPDYCRRIRNQDGTLSTTRIEYVTLKNGVWKYAGCRGWTPDMDKEARFVVEELAPIPEGHFEQLCFQFVKTLLRTKGYSLDKQPTDRMLGNWAKQMSVSLDDVKEVVYAALSSIRHDNSCPLIRKQTDARLAADEAAR